jgi:hypothetical protein
LVAIGHTWTYYIRKSDPTIKMVQQRRKCHFYRPQIKYNSLS